MGSDLDLLRIMVAVVVIAISVTYRTLVQNASDPDQTLNLRLLLSGLTILTQGLGSDQRNCLIVREIVR